MSSGDEREKPIICARLAGADEDEAKAEAVWRTLKEQADPDNRIRKFSNQRIVIKALIALGEKEGVLSAEDRLDLILAAVSRIEHNIQALPVEIDERIAALVRDGKLSSEAASSVNTAIKDAAKAVEDTWAANQARNLRPARRPGKQE